MTIGARSTAEQMVARVGGILDLDITADTVPSQWQVLDWLNEAPIEMIKLLPDQMMVSLTHENSWASVGGRMYTTESASGEIPVKILSVKKFGKPCKIVNDAGEFEFASTHMGYVYDQNFPLCLKSGYTGIPTLEFYPDSLGDVEVKFIAKPHDYTIGSDDSSNTLMPPASWEKMIVDYAVMRGRQQDEEPGQAQQQFEMWVNSVKMSEAMEGFGSDVVN